MHRSFPAMLGKYGHANVTISQDSLLNDSSIFYKVQIGEDTITVSSKQRNCCIQKGTIDLTDCHDANSGLFLQSLREEIALQRGDTIRLKLHGKNSLTYGAMYLVSPILGRAYFDYNNPLYTAGDKYDHIFQSFIIEEIVPFIPLMITAPQGSIKKAKPIFWCFAGLWFVRRLDGFFSKPLIKRYNRFIETGYVFDHKKKENFDNLPMLQSGWYSKYGNDAK